MRIFGKQLFRSKNAEIESFYKAGTRAIAAGQYETARSQLTKAAKGDHASACYNLYALHAGGNISPYEIDTAAHYFQQAAALSHPRANSELYLLEAADRAGFGYDNFLDVIKACPRAAGYLPPIAMLCACRFTYAVCKKYNIMHDVIAFELDGASYTEKDFVQSFIKRTGLTADFYQGGMDRVESISAAGSTTDGFNKLTRAMRASGIDEDLAIVGRCTILGYLISKSSFGSKSKPLLGVKEFLKAR